MTIDIRPIPFEDATASQRLGLEAFGFPATPPPAPAADRWPPANMSMWGAYDDGALVAKVGVRAFTSWFHGSRVATAGIGGVTVAAESRGDGLLRPLFDVALPDARERGAVISTLYPSSAGIYRGLGYEVIGSYDDARIPMSALARVRPPAAGYRARRATPDDLPAIVRVYETWASRQNGPLSRAEEPFAFTADEMFGPKSEYTGVTLALDTDGDVVGFASWSRGEGVDRKNAIEVDDLVALTPDAARVLWRTVGSFGMVVGDVVVSTSGGWTGADPSRLVLPDHAARTSTRIYMLRMLDVAGAVSAAGFPPLTARVPFAVVDARTPDIEGAWTLEVSDGVGRAVPDDIVGDPSGDRLTFDSAGLAASYAGAASTANLRLAGHVTGPTTHDTLWDALWHGRDVHVRDFF